MRKKEKAVRGKFKQKLNQLLRRVELTYYYFHPDSSLNSINPNGHKIRTKRNRILELRLKALQLLFPALKSSYLRGN